MRLVALTLALVLGLASSPAAVPAAAQVPDGMEVTGWILQSGSNRLVARNADGITTLSVAAVALTANGGGVARPNADHERLRRAAHRHELVAELLLTNYSNRLEAFDPERLHRLLSSPRKIQRVADRLAGFVAAGWDGVNIDLERVRERDGDGLVALARALQDAMPAEKTVSIDVSAAPSVESYRDRGYRLAGLRDAVDVVDLMTYDLHGPWSGPGPIGDLAWQRRSLEALLTVVPPEQVQLGVAGYGYTWPREGTGRSVTVKQAERLVERSGATARWRPGPGEWTALLPNGTRLWWSDGRSYERRVDLAREYGLRGLAVWRLGSADTLT
ncbi:glycosyl hydrolase family 18 protein [Nocardioides pyridinolyticus]